VYILQLIGTLKRESHEVTPSSATGAIYSVSIHTMSSDSDLSKVIGYKLEDKFVRMFKSKPVF